MKKAFKSGITVILSAAFAACMPLCADAESVKVETITVTLPEFSSADTVSVSSSFLPGASADCLEDINYYFVSLADADALASEIASSAVLRETTLESGKKTVNISIDFEQGQNRALLNNLVIRKTAKKLVEAENAAVPEGGSDDYTLMDSIHIVGETELHLIGYEVSKALGGSGGMLGSIYESCRVADLNTDEARFGGLIRVFGVLYSGIFN